MSMRLQDFLNKLLASGKCRPMIARESDMPPGIYALYLTDVQRR
jgi:hypothetical protein